MANLIDIIDDAIRDETEDTTPDIDADFLLTSDTSATAPKKVKPANILGTALAGIRALTPSNDDFLQRKAGAWANRTVAQVKTDLSLTGTNSGDETATTLGATINAAGAATPNNGDFVATAESGGLLKKITWTNVKAFLKTYFDTLYLTASNIDDTAYDATTWNGDTTHAPSKNAVRDKIESLGSASVSDTVYGAGWNGDTTAAPSKNAVYDKVETLQPLDSDLTTIAGLTATTDSFMQSKSSAWAARTITQVLADLQGTGVGSLEAGFRNIPQNSQSAAYTTVAADSGKHIFHPAADTNARTFTIDSNANVAYPVGTAITFINETSQVVTIAITSDTMTLAGTTTTGSRSLAQNGVATAIKTTSTKWIISGTGLS